MTEHPFEAEPATYIIEPLLRLPDVKRATGASKRTIYRWMQQGHFPRAIRTGPGSVAWRESDISRWQKHLCAHNSSG